MRLTRERRARDGNYFDGSSVLFDGGRTSALRTALQAGAEIVAAGDAA
jgi:hypothetical protein